MRVSEKVLHSHRPVRNGSRGNREEVMLSGKAISEFSAPRDIVREAGQVVCADELRDKSRGTQEGGEEEVGQLADAHAAFTDREGQQDRAEAGTKSLSEDRKEVVVKVLSDWLEDDWVNTTREKSDLWDDRVADSEEEMLEGEVLHFSELGDCITTDTRTLSPHIIVSSDWTAHNNSISGSC